MQWRWIPDPASQILHYITLWVVTAVASAAVIAVQAVTRAQRLHSGMSDEMIGMAVEQFLPCVLVGGLLTLTLWHSAPSASWMLPGLWQVIFSLGVASSACFLPRAITVAGAWYLLTGLACLSLGDSRALAPWFMGVSFGVGQLWVAGVLLLRLKEAWDEA